MSSVKLRNFDVVGSVYVLIALLLFSTGSIFIRYFTGYFDSWTQNFYRYAVGGCFWLPYLVFCVHKKQWDHSIWWRAIGPAVANVLMQSVSARAIYYIEPAFMMLLFQSSVIWVVVFSLIFFTDERGLIRCAANGVISSSGNTLEGSFTALYRSLESLTNFFCASHPAVARILRGKEWSEFKKKCQSAVRGAAEG